MGAQTSVIPLAKTEEYVPKDKNKLDFVTPRESQNI
jgi:hypothetical protein